MQPFIKTFLQATLEFTTLQSESSREGEREKRKSSPSAEQQRGRVCSHMQILNGHKIGVHSGELRRFPVWITIMLKHSLSFARIHMCETWFSGAGAGKEKAGKGLLGILGGNPISETLWGLVSFWEPETCWVRSSLLVDILCGPVHGEVWNTSP